MGKAAQRKRRVAMTQFVVLVTYADSSVDANGFATLPEAEAMFKVVAEMLPTEEGLLSVELVRRGTGEVVERVQREAVNVPPL